MESISVFDMFKIGVGPSSSHTLGPWVAARAFIDELRQANLLAQTSSTEIHLYGSLALTGEGHGTDIAVLLGLMDTDPKTIPVDQVTALPLQIKANNELLLGGDRLISFFYNDHLVFHYTEVLPGHANGMRLEAFDTEGHLLLSSVYYSIGGGFILKEGEQAGGAGRVAPPFPITTAKELRSHCLSENSAIWELVLENEKRWFTTKQVFDGLCEIWTTMEACIYRGCHTKGELPGGLRVKRRAAGMMQNLMGKEFEYDDAASWIACIRSKDFRFHQIVKWISCFAMAVNEENANFGRVVTSPTNGAAGVIPAVMMYYLCFTDQEVGKSDIVKFLLTAGEIGSIFKKGSTISAAMGGCQAEIGVSSAMAAGALTERLGGSIGQSLMAAEIAMEHHLGLTCDPVGGLVQVPCIERNSMGAVKAIMAANIALESDPSEAKVSLDEVINTMWQTAQDMNTKYKETSQGGLAVNIAISLPEC